MDNGLKIMRKSLNQFLSGYSKNLYQRTISFSEVKSYFLRHGWVEVEPNILKFVSNPNYMYYLSIYGLMFSNGIKVEWIFKGDDDDLNKLKSYSHNQIFTPIYEIFK